MIAFALALIFTGRALAAQVDHQPIRHSLWSQGLPPTVNPQPSSISAFPPLHPFVFSPPRLLTSSLPPLFPPSPSIAPFGLPEEGYRLPSTDEGSELYQFWCSTCHGDQGQGLTKEWRATWPEGKQNCWQSKCHAANHPPEGFILPKNVPPLIGPNTLTKFRTAQDLYVYSRATMPYWSPNLLKDDEYRAITAFLVKANYAAQGVPLPTPLSDDWTVVSLHPHEAVVEESLADKNLEASQSSTILPKPETSVEAQPPESIVSLSESLWRWAAIMIAGGGLVIWLTRRFLFPMNKKG